MVYCCAIETARHYETCARLADLGHAHGPNTPCDNVHLQNASKKSVHLKCTYHLQVEQDKEIKRRQDLQNADRDLREIEAQSTRNRSEDHD